MNSSSFSSRRTSRNEPPKRQWWKLIVWVFLLVGGWFLWDSLSYSSALKNTVSQQENPIDIVIELGLSPTAIAEQLEEKEVVVSAKHLLKYLKSTGQDTRLYAGEYTISSHLTIPEVAKLLTTPAQFVSITIPEGLTLEEMDDLFASKGYFKDDEFLICILSDCDFSGFGFLPDNRSEWEGYFFPATYSLKETEITPQQLAEQMLLAFEQRISIHGLKNNTRSLNDILIMASLIEKESSSHQGNESAMIAGILWNRIDQGIPLGVDASTRYALGKTSDPLTRTDLSHGGPFNTRLNKGFPPHAISAPGDASLKAAANPADTKYLYYLHDQTGQIRYAMTNAQHEQNKSNYCGGSCE